MNLMDLFVRIGIKDEASEGIDTVGSKLKTGLATAAKVGAAAVTAAGAGLAAAAVSPSRLCNRDAEKLVTVSMYSLADIPAVL